MSSCTFGDDLLRALDHYHAKTLSPSDKQNKERVLMYELGVIHGRHEAVHAGVVTIANAQHAFEECMKTTSRHESRSHCHAEFIAALENALL